MCVNFILHHTNCETRERSIVNPRTGLTMYNPFISPGYVDIHPGDRPAAEEFQGRIVTGECPSHGSHCLLKRSFVCYRSEPCRTFPPFHKVIPLSEVSGDGNPASQGTAGPYLATNHPAAKAGMELSVPHVRELFFGVGNRLWKIQHEYWVNMNGSPPPDEHDSSIWHLLRQWSQDIERLSGLAKSWSLLATLGHIEPFPGDDLATGLNQHIQLCEPVAPPPGEVDLSQWRPLESRHNGHEPEVSTELEGYGNQSHIVGNFALICPQMMAQHTNQGGEPTVRFNPQAGPQHLPSQIDDDDLPDYASSEDDPIMTRSAADVMSLLEDGNAGGNRWHMLPPLRTPPPILVCMEFAPINWHQEASNRATSRPVSPHTRLPDWDDVPTIPERNGASTSGWHSKPPGKAITAEDMAVDYVTSCRRFPDSLASAASSALSEISSTDLLSLERELYGAGASGRDFPPRNPNPPRQSGTKPGRKRVRPVRNYRSSPYNLRRRQRGSRKH